MRAADATGTPEVIGSELRRRSLGPRSAAGVAVVVGALAVAVWRAPLSWSDVGERIRHAHPLPYLAALGVCYVSLALRAARWQVLLRNAGERCSLAPLLGCLLGSFAVNCLLPARVGDLLRAYLVRRRERVPAAKTFGTIVVERVIDLLTVLALVGLAAALSLRRGAGHGVGVAVVLSLLAGAAGVALLVMMHTGGLDRLTGHLPPRARRLYEGFRVGSLGALGRWRIVLLMTLGIWMLDTVRFGLVAAAVGEAARLGPARILLVTLIAALLSTTPFLPGGLGAVESGVVLVLTSVAGLGAGPALSIVLLDRGITYGSVVVTGLLSLAVLQRPGAARAASTRTADEGRALGQPAAELTPRATRGG